MPGDVTFRIEGAAEMARLLKQLGPTVARRVGALALRAAAKPIVDRAKQLVPVDTGALRESIGSEIVNRGTGRESRVIAIGVERPVSRRFHLTEFGAPARGLPAQPFLRPSLDEQKETALNEMGRVLADGITRAAERQAGVGGRGRR